ncbi:uncharacterized protein [Argopecten irradians]|uniref:uncharacterized protein n=1 Tax=Argopecten irradians TaxID=31199 RepID=UPI003719273B
MVEHNLTTDGIQKSFGEVMCPLGNIRKRRSPGSSISSYTKLLLSDSNNAHNFSNPVPVVIFDSACMSCTLPGGRIVCKQRNDICVTTDQCYPLESKMCHQKTHGRKDNDDKDQQDSKLWIIGAVLGGVALLFIVIIVLYKTFVKKKMAVGEQYIEEPYPDLNRYNNPPASTHFQK